MERFELEKGLADEIRARVFGEGFIKIVQSVRRGGATFRISMRRVALGGSVKYQAEMAEDGQVQVKNFDRAGAADGQEEIIAQKGARELHLICADGDLHVRVTRKGRVLVSRSAPMNRTAEVRPHDRVKNLPLTAFDSAALLRVTGLADASGQIRASMRGKYDQVNEFLRLVPSALCLVPGAECLVPGAKDDAPRTPHQAPSTKHQAPLPPFTVVDCGCGKAYLTLSLYFYLTAVLKVPNVTVYGVDRRADVIASARKMAEALDVADRVLFVESDLAAFTPALQTVATSAPLPTSVALKRDPPNLKSHNLPISQSHNPPKVDMVVSLHACDTATDEALAKAVEWRARYILSAPCCQHELQKRLGEMSGRAVGPAEVFGGLLRQSILRERLCDLLTDSFRAMILRILGFKVQVIEFVSPDATARNIMLKAEYGVKPGQAGPVGEYLALRDYWGVTPWLESRLLSLLGRHLARFQ